MIMSFWVKMSPQFSNPLVSSIVTLYALVLLYLPSIVFSPVLIITAVLLLSLLRLGATQRSLPNDKPSDETTQEYDRSDVELLDCTETDSDSDSETSSETGPSFENSFVKWNLRAPLEVIYEDHEEGDEEASGTGRYENLARFYPESDSGDSSDGDFSATGFCGSPENLRFEWEEEDERDDGLIEIALDGNAMKRDCNNEKIRGFHFHVDEENLIEIDISPVRSHD